MTSMKAIKKALISSVLAVVICVAMLAGSTFAWFTDSVTSANNKIVAGNLDVDLYLWDANGSTEITNTSAPIFGVDETALVNGTARAQDDAANTLWEPGKTQVVYLSIKNNGTLDMKYKVALNVQNPEGGKDLYEVLQYAITNDAHYSNTDPAWVGGVDVVPGVNDTQAVDVALKAGEEHFFALSIHMLETAGNEYMNGSVIFDIQVLAGQLASESDSFGNGYDVDADFPGTGFVTVEGGKTSYQIEVRGVGGNDPYKDASFDVPAEAIANGVTQLSAVVKDSAYVGNFTVAAGLEKTVLDITVVGLKEGNTTPVKVMLKIPTGLDPATVQPYHYDEEITDFTYDPTDGYVSFETATFSPFTVLYDADSKYEAPEVSTDKYPTAKVSYMGQYVNTQLNWGSYGQWSPTEGLDANLEAAFEFACPDYATASAEQKALIDAYRYWYCDFYVSLDKDLGANQIFLGGNYGTFGWVGFHNGELTLPANTELGLLESVTTNPWTYDDVESFVGKFICGVGDVNNALEGATFTVKLRLTNPENTAEFVDVNTVTYTFGGNSVIDGVQHVTTAEGLQDAANNGGNIVLEDDIDLSQGLVIPGN